MSREDLSRPALAGISAGISEEHAEQQAQSASARAQHSEKIAPYAADPLLPLEEGRIQVFDPDVRGPVVLRPFPSQVELIVAWITQEFVRGVGRLGNVHIEKSRQMGDTTILAYAVLWLLTYHRARLLMVHQELKKVADHGFTLDSFWGIVKYIYDRWPADIGRADLAFTRGNEGKPSVTGSDGAYLHGAAGTTPDPGRGGNYDGVVMDEAARFQYDHETFAALRSACPSGRVMLSTPNGEGNIYFQLREDRPRGWMLLRHHWSQNPKYAEGLHVAGADRDCPMCEGVRNGVRWEVNPDGTHRFPGKLTSPWYEAMVSDMPDHMVAAELDIDYAGSLHGRVYPRYSTEIHVAAEEFGIDQHLPIELGWDFGVTESSTAIGVYQNTPKEFRAIAALEVRQQPPEGVVEQLAAFLRDLGAREVVIRDPDVRAATIDSVGDPAGEATSITTATSTFVEYAKLGWPINPPGVRDVQLGIDAVDRLLMGKPKRLVINPGEPADPLRRAFRSYKWETDRQGNVKPGKRKPQHDEYSHVMDQLRYRVVSNWPFVQSETEAREALRPKPRRARRRVRDTDRLSADIGPEMAY